MLKDIEIANTAKLLPIQDVAAKLTLSLEDIELYGSNKAKIPLRVLENKQNQPDGKLVLVTAMNPTPAGEGKTTMSIGLAQALAKENHKVVLALREPSLGPVFGVKGGAAGGGYSQVLPMEELNLHFTGDLHAITSANNLLAAMIDNHLFQGNPLQIDKDRILWKRCLDMNDRVLRHCLVGLGGKTNGVEREEEFTITAASEIMSILCLAENIEDLKRRLGAIAIAYDLQGNLLTASQLSAEGAMTLLLKDAIKPNLIQSIEHVPALIHGGPFANISHGCNSIIATKMALKLADIVVTEAGFGADLGAEKFLNIKCRVAGLKPSAVVLVVTIRSLKYNANLPKDKLTEPNLAAVEEGFANVAKHISNLKAFGIPCVVAANQFHSDTPEELELLKRLCLAQNTPFAAATIFAQGGEGGLELAQVVSNILKENPLTPPLKHTYQLEESIPDKIRQIARQIYGASDIEISEKAEDKIASFSKLGYNKLPICMAKTQYSLSDDPKKLGCPKDFTLKISDIRLSAGAGYIVVLTGKIMTMPGLPEHPAAMDIDLSPEGNAIGLF